MGPKTPTKTKIMLTEGHHELSILYSSSMTDRLNWLFGFVEMILGKGSIKKCEYFPDFFFRK